MALLVLGVGADHPDHAFAADDLAVLTDSLDAAADFHGSPSGLAEVPGSVAVRDPALGQIVGADLDGHAVARKNPDVVHPHLAGDPRHDLVAVLQLHAEHRAAERFEDLTFELDRVFLGHVAFLLLSVGQDFRAVGGDGDRVFIMRRGLDRKSVV